MVWGGIADIVEEWECAKHLPDGESQQEAGGAKNCQKVALAKTPQNCKATRFVDGIEGRMQNVIVHFLLIFNLALSFKFLFLSTISVLIVLEKNTTRYLQICFPKLEHKRKFDYFI